MEFVLPISRAVPFTILAGAKRSEVIDSQGLTPMLFLIG